jgi:hypothetical protein
MVREPLHGGRQHRRVRRVFGEGWMAVGRSEAFNQRLCPTDPLPPPPCSRGVRGLNLPTATVRPPRWNPGRRGAFYERALPPWVRPGRLAGHGERGTGTGRRCDRTRPSAGLPPGPPTRPTRVSGQRRHCRRPVRRVVAVVHRAGLPKPDRTEWTSPSTAAPGEDGRRLAGRDHGLSEGRRRRQQRADGDRVTRGGAGARGSGGLPHTRAEGPPEDGRGEKAGGGL